MKTAKMLLNYANQEYNISLTRRENIRKRTNATAVLSLTIMAIFVTSILNNINIYGFEVTFLNVALIILSVIFFAKFLFFYFKIHGPGKITGYDPESTVSSLESLFRENLKMKEMYNRKIEEFKRLELNNEKLLAYDYVHFFYLSCLYAKTSNSFNEKNAEINKDFKIMFAFIFATIIALIILKGLV